MSRVISDPDGLAPVVALPKTLLISTTENGCESPPQYFMSDACDASPSVGDNPLVPLSGVWTGGSGLSLSGTGSVAGVSGVSATFVGSDFGLGGHGAYGRKGGGLNGAYTVGTHGELGGAPVVYEIRRKPGKPPAPFTASEEFCP